MKLSELIEQEIETAQGFKLALLRALVDCKITDEAGEIYNYFLGAQTRAKRIKHDYQVFISKSDYELIKRVYNSILSYYGKIKNLFMPFKPVQGNRAVLVIYNHGKYLPLKPNKPWRIEDINGLYVVTKDSGVALDKNTTIVRYQGENIMLLVNINYKSTYDELRDILL